MKDYQIETILGPNNNEVSFCTKRGGLVTSLKFDGQEILYFDEETFKNKELPIRGGIPFLFPNAGELIENKIFPNLKRHGFARDLEWQIEEIENGLKESLSFNKQTHEIYPYNFMITNWGFFEKDGSFTLSQIVENNEEIKKMPISMGLHPYFKVSNEEKKNIKFNFEGGKQIEEQFDIWANGGTVYIDNPKIKEPKSSLNIYIPTLGTLIINPSVEFQKIWIWSLPGKDFICIEPVMRDKNGLIDDPELIKPKSQILLDINIQLLKEKDDFK